MAKAERERERERERGGRERERERNWLFSTLIGLNLRKKLVKCYIWSTAI